MKKKLIKQVQGYGKRQYAKGYNEARSEAIDELAEMKDGKGEK